MELKYYILEKFEQSKLALELAEKQVTILVNSINNCIKETVESAITVGEIISFEDINYEIIDFRKPKIYEFSYKDLKELKYNFICLKLMNSEIDKSNFGKRIRKDKSFSDEKYSRKGLEKLREYYKSNVIEITRDIFPL